MSDYRRRFVLGGTYFFTVVVHERYPLFDSPVARAYLSEAIDTVRTKKPFDLFAICLLPDHLHVVWTLPSGDSDYPIRWRQIKERFTNRWLSNGGWEGELSDSRKKKGERGIWQRRYWEHVVRDTEDLTRCTDYIHWNPRKYGLVRRVRDWSSSSFFRFVEAGSYEMNWGGGVDLCEGWDEPEWGE